MLTMILLILCVYAAWLLRRQRIHTNAVLLDNDRLQAHNARLEMDTLNLSILFRCAARTYFLIHQPK